MIYMNDYLEENETSEIIRNALAEDISTGDITSNSVLQKNQMATAQLIAKQDLVLCGLQVFEQTFKCVDQKIIFKPFHTDGNNLVNKTLVAEISGSIISLLTAERTALNFLQRMSGIATLTNNYVQKVKGTKTVILDTRKTVPGLRMFDKYAVKTGGGQNHRIGLYDMVLIKENHITGAGGITQAVQKVLDKQGHKYEIEVEVKNLVELQEALELAIDRILLDNMSLEEMKKAVHLVNGKIPLEASGNVNLESVKAIAETGVDFISIGGLTHSVSAADLSLIIV